MAQYSFERLRPEYVKLWSEMRVIKTADARAHARRIAAPASKARYKTVEKKSGVPWFVVGVLHMRESNGDFNTWLHNGDPMRRGGRAVQTIHVPKGRPPNPNVDWETGAVDALVNVENLDQIKDWGPEHVAYASEKFNGFGYRHPDRNIPSPYLWGGTNVQKKGKFVKDGVYDPNAMDTQIGAMAMLSELMAIDPEARFVEQQPEPAEPPPSVPTGPPPISPRADDTQAEVKPALKGKTIWGGVITWLGGMIGTFFGQFQYIATPWGFAAMVFITVALGLGLYLIIKGRLDVQKVVEHLSQDDDDD